MWPWLLFGWWLCGFVILLCCMYVWDDGLNIRDVIVSAIGGIFGLMNLFIWMEISKAHWLNAKFVKKEKDRERK